LDLFQIQKEFEELFAMKNLQNINSSPIYKLLFIDKF
jgi:hypothetical protein